jgi:type IV pilus assembly protein PilE
MSRRPGERGVTLIELMVVVLILGIIAGVAIPSYRGYMVRSQRTDATSALLRIATAQEKFYLQNNTYAGNAVLDDDPPAGLGIDGSEHGWYTLSITAADATGWTAQAATVSSGPQGDDEDCQTFTLNDRGVRTATNSGGATSTDTCWR